MKSFAVFAICLLQIAVGVFGTGHYTVIGPGTLHSARKYNVAVAVHDTTEPCKLKVGITGPSYNESKIVELNNADEVKLVEFDVPELEKGTYNLTADGVAGVEFHNSTKLNYQRFQPYVFIQTDKGTYKPGDVVQYRVIFLDENLKPSDEVGSSALVYFEDNKRNRVKEIKDLKVVKGVYTGKFELSEYAALGNWRLNARSGDGGSSKQVYFKVDKYVLPKYQVKLEANERVSVKDGDIHAVVKANYTYGKPVNGKVTLLLEVQNSYWRGYNDDTKEMVEIPAIIKVTDMVNGKAKFDFSVKEYEAQINKKYPSGMQITATVEEEFTGVKLNGSTSGTLFPYRYQMMCESWSTCSTYHADKEAELEFKIMHVDGSLLKDTKSVVRLTFVEAFRDITWWVNNEEAKEVKVAPTPAPEERLRFTFESHLNESSIAVFKVTLPDLPELEGYQHFFEGTLEYLDEKNEVVSSYPYRKPKETDEPTTKTNEEEPKEYLKMEVDYEKDKYSIPEGVEASITINSSEPLQYFVYTIVGRGNVLVIKRVELPEPQKVVKFKVTPTYDMAPYGKVYLHYVKDGEYKYAETTFYVDWEFKNKISIDAAKEVKVGEDVALTIKTEPNSFVGLLGIDQSVLLLRQNNDISEDQVRWRLGQYSTSTPYQGGFSRYPGDQSGVVTLTNAHYFYNMTKPEWYVHHESADADEGGVVRDGVHPVSAFAAGAPTVGLSGVAQSANAPPRAPAVRKDFAETWIFANIENTESESFTWVKKIPDTITSWLVSGFSLNPIKGIASTKEATTIKAFQPFFISIRLPYSVKRGEVISVPALVFNYLEKDLDVEVTLENSDNEFEFTEVTNEVIDVEKRTKTVRVPGNSARGVSFMIRPTVIGNNLLKFTAISPIAGDAIHKPLKVVPEGITEYANRAFFVNLKDAPEAKETFELELPAEIVPDSDHAEFSVVGDLLGPLLDNLDTLVRLPTGCGEQTMSSYVPNYLLMRYLKSINKLNPSLESRIKLHLERGYQNILHFQHKDGSFSSFGPETKKDEKPRNGSTWLTAYVMRFLQQSAEFINLDEKIIESGLKYLAEHQADNGSFTESGDFFYISQRNEVSLTSSVVLALLEKQKTSSEYDAHIEKGLKFILENMDKEEIDLRIKSLAIFALQQAKHEMAAKKLAEMQALAKTDTDRRWWSTEDESIKLPILRGYCCWWRWPRSAEVETTAYNLLTILDQNPESEHVLPILKWLVAQRNNYGGFSSTQDTVVGLQALIKFAEISGYEAAEMNVDFKSQGGVREKSEDLKITNENSLLLQSYELPAKTRSVEFHAQGKGAALVQVSYQYNIYEKDPSPSFELKTIVNKETPLHKLELDVCVEYVGKDGQSNMAIMEVNLPSGYTADLESFDELRKVGRVRHVESKNGDTTVVIYFESLKKGESKCLLIEGYKAFAVAMQKPAPVVVYDYYDTAKKATSYYEVVSKICDICDKEEEDCQKICN